MIQVSILVPTKNRPQFLSNILRNFFRQDYPLQNMELIIGDDGDGERYAAVSKYVVDNAISNVTFVGKVDRSVMEEYLNNMDIGVIPMISSSIPNKVFDYIASYLPILVLGDNDSASFAVSHSVGWQIPYTAEGVSVFLSELQASDIHAKAQNISKIRDLYDRENLFSKVKDLIES